MARYIKYVGDISEEIEGTPEEIIKILAYLDTKEEIIEHDVSTLETKASVPLIEEIRERINMNKDKVKRIEEEIKDVRLALEYAR